MGVTKGLPEECSGIRALPRGSGCGPAELAAVEVGVEAIPTEKRCVGATFHDASVPYGQDQVGALDRGEAVGDHDARAAFL